MKLYRCRICGDTYLGAERPSHCPFCGAELDYIVESRDYPADINDVQLTEREKADLEASVEVELSNTRFYLAAAKNPGNDALTSYFKRLAKVEAEHCELFCKLLRVDKPADLMEPGESTGSFGSDLEDSLQREDKARNLYREFHGRATNERVKEVFEAVGRVEETHIELDREAKTYL